MPKQSKFTIVGLSQSGLTLAHQLLGAGHEVRLIGSNTSGELRGRRSLTQLSFPSTYEVEQAAGLYGPFTWEQEAPRLSGVELSLRAADQPPAVLSGGWEGGRYGLSVDRGFKNAEWLEYFEDRGGKVNITSMTPDGLEMLLSMDMADLIIMADGSSNLAELFPPDHEHSAGADVRSYAQALIVGAQCPRDRILAASRPEGEVYMIPVLTSAGPVTSVLMAARKGWAAMDCHQAADMFTPKDDEVWARIQERLSAYIPDFAEYCESARLLTDGQGPATMLTTIDPRMRKPVGVLRTGNPVLGLCEVIQPEDPAGLQTWGNATRSADITFRAIQQALETGRPFDAEWMQETHGIYWEQAGQFATALSGMIDGFWSGDLPPHYRELALTATQNRTVAEEFFKGWDKPASFGWIADPAKVRAFLDEATAGSDA